jgi:hypothetical protein
LISIAALRDRYRGNVEPERSQRYLELTALLLALLVVVQLLWLGLGALRESSVTPIEPARDSLRVLSAAGTGAITGPQSLELQSRPLFWASRRPSDTVVVAGPGDQSSDLAPAPRLENLQLLGALGAADEGAAIVSFKGKTMRLAVGDDIDGWVLQSVSLGQAVFVSAGVRDVRRLLPQPVLATDSEPPLASGSNATIGSTGGAAPRSEQKNTVDSATDDIQPRGSLSLGGR